MREQDNLQHNVVSNEGFREVLRWVGKEEFTLVVRFKLSCEDLKGSERQVGRKDILLWGMGKQRPECERPMNGPVWMEQDSDAE